MPRPRGGAWRRDSHTRNLRSTARVATLPRRGHRAAVPRPLDHALRRRGRARVDRDAATAQPKGIVLRRLRRLAVAATERAAVRRRVSRPAAGATPGRAPRVAARALAHGEAL